MPGVTGQKLVGFDEIQEVFAELGYVTTRPRDKNNHGFPICVDYMRTLRVVFVLGSHFQADRFIFEEDGDDILQVLGWEETAELYWKPRKKLGVVNWNAPIYEEDRDYVKVEVEDFVKLCRKRIEENELLGSQKDRQQAHPQNVPVSNPQSQNRDGQGKRKEERIPAV